jgi:YVTN family beta-propeller protein
MRAAILVRALGALGVAVVVGCGSNAANPEAADGSSDTGMTNPGKDAASDSGKRPDSSSAHDSGHDSGTPPGDAGNDQSSPGDSGADVATDTGMDAGPVACAKTAAGQLRGSAIALTSDSTRLVVVNRSSGSVTIMSIDYTMANDPALTEVAELAVGNEPWQVVIDACDQTAYVVLREDQKVVQINDILGTPTVGSSVAVGSEPSALALTPNNTALYVSNWVDGNVSVINPLTMKVTSTIDLNPTLAATGFLGPDVQTTPRAGLAHPRGIAVTNNGDTSDSDETVYVTEWFAVRTAPEKPGTPLTSDANWKGLLYQIPVATGTPATIDLPPVLNTGFNDAKGGVTGCFPNQVASVSLENEGTPAAPQYYAYVSSTCASPAGPVGVFQFGACQINANCSTFGALSTCDTTKGVCTESCTTDAQCGVGSAAGACNPATGECAPLPSNAKTTTHPGLTIVNLTTATPTSVTSTLDTAFTTAAMTGTGVTSTRMPLLPTDIDFKPGFAYVAAEGADALFRLTVAGGAITKVGSTTNDFIDLHTTASPTLRLPIGVAISADPTKPVAFVADDGTRTVSAINLSVQAASASTTGEAASSPLPTAGSPAASVLNGKRFFTTGLGRWSLAGAAWGSCAGCHIDGLTDNVTWYFARGPRQTTSLDGTFGKNPAAGTVDQRILNWGGINDEIADFETNVRGISGGVGAIVSAISTPPANADRVNLISSMPPQSSLEGSSASAALGGGTTASTNWQDIANYVAQIRSPRAVTASLFAAADITSGQATFASATCNGCHSGEKWTISTVFYAPGNVPNDVFGSAATTSLGLTNWDANLNNFPTKLFPSALATGKTDMRSGAPTGFEQLQCILRPVGTITANGAVPTGVSPAAVNVWEVRQDMVTGAQGAGGTNANDFTEGFNIPSLLGVQVGAPYFHAGNARSLEELLNNPDFLAHAQALGAIFTPTPTAVKQLTAYLLSIDGSTTPIALPTGPSAEGGDICHYP